MHHVRNASYDKHRLHFRSGRLAGNLAESANAAFSIVHLKGRFPRMPQNNCHYAARQGDALREITRPGLTDPG